MENKMYLRVPEYTDKEGTYTRLFTSGGKSIALPEELLQNLNDGSTVIKVTNDTLYIDHVGHDDALTIKLPELPSETLCWIWLCQPKYRPGDTIKGFIVVRERLNMQSTALRKSNQRGTIALEGNDAIVLARPLDFEKMVSIFEFETSKHLQNGDYKIEVKDENKSLVGSLEFNISQFEKKDFVIQIEAPSWVKEGEEIKIVLSGSYYHGEFVKKGEISLKYGEEVRKEKIDSRKTTFIIENLPVGSQSFTLEMSDEHGTTEEKEVVVVVAETSALIKINEIEKARTHLPIKFNLLVTNPTGIPLPKQVVTIRWDILGKMATKQLEEKTKTLFTDENGMIKFEEVFLLNGLYKYTIRVELRGEVIAISEKILVERTIQGYFELENKLEKDRFTEGEEISGEISLIGHKTTINNIKYGYLDLISDRIVETMRIKLKKGKAKYTFDGISNFYGTIAVDFYVNTHIQKIETLSELTTDKAGCVVKRAEAALEPPYPTKISMTLDTPKTASTGSKINLVVKVDGELVNEDFHIFGALIDHRILVDHLDTSLYKTFLKKPRAMKINVMESKQKQKDYSHSSLFTMHGSSSRGGQSNWGNNIRSSILGEIKSFAGTLKDSQSLYSTHSYSASSGGFSLGGLSDEMLQEVERLKKMFPNSSLKKSFIPAVQRIIRTNFAESLILRPKVIKEREAVFEIEVPDAVSTFEFMIFGVNNCQFGWEHKSIIIKNPVFTQLTNPSEVVYNDEVEIKAIVHNTTEERIEKVTARLLPINCLELLSSRDVSIQKIDAHSSAKCSWKVRATKVGYAHAEVEVQLPNFYEVLTFDQPLYIKAPNEPHVKVRQDYLTEESALDFIWTLDGNQAYALGKINILPALELATIDGLEALARYPHGCCEQTCSATLPNVIVYEYLDAKEQLNEETREMLLQNMRGGLEILLKYKNVDGGFSYWGRESTIFHTALAMSVISRIKPYIKEIPEDLFDEALRYLKDSKTSGIWPSFKHCSIAPRDLSVRGMNAYILHSLALSGQRDKEAVRHMVNNYTYYKDDPTVIALMLDSFGKIKEYRDEFPDFSIKLKNGLLKLMKKNDDRIAWEQGSALTDSRGKYSVETTAYALLALNSAFPNNRDLFEIYQGGIKYLLSQRRGTGWGSTRDTLYASMAITALGKSEKPDFTLTIKVNEEEVFKEVLDKTTMAWKIYDFREIFLDQLKDGNNEITLTMNGTGSCHVVSELSQWSLGASEKRTLPIEVEKDLEGDLFEVGEELIMKLIITPKELCQSMMIEQPLPSLTELSSEGLSTLEGLFDHCELQDRTLCMFLERVTKVITIEIPLKITGVGTCLVESTKIYEMYNTELEYLSPASELLIN